MAVTRPIARTTRIRPDGDTSAGLSARAGTGQVWVDTADPTRQQYHPFFAIQLTFRFDATVTRVQAPPTPTPGESVSSRAIGPIPMVSPQRETGDSVFTRIIIPTECDISLPNHRTAAEWSATYLYRDLPIHPKLIKQASAVVAVICIPSTEWAEIQSGTRTLASVFQGMNLFTLANTSGLIEATTVWGPLDEMELTIDEHGHSVKISGRDPIGLLANTPVLAATLDKFDLDQTIHNVVRQILSTHQTQNDLASCVVGDEDPTIWPDGIIPMVAWDGSDPPDRQDPDNAQKRKPKKKKRRAKRPPNAALELSLWDLISQYAFLVGAIPRWRGRYLEIMPARGLYEQSVLAGQDRSHPSPFAGGKTRFSSGEPLRFRHLVVGQDVVDVKVTRRFISPKAQPVRVVSYVSGRGRGRAKVLEAIYPEDKDLPQFKEETKLDVSPDGKHTQTQYIEVSRPGIDSVKRLREIAKALFEERQKGEFKGTATVHQLSSQLGSYRDPDMLRLKPGDGFRLTAARDESFGDTPTAQGDIHTHGRLSRDALVARLQERFGTDDESRRLAEVLASTITNDVLQIDDDYYVLNVKLSGRNTTGVQCAFDFVDYSRIAAVEDKPTPEPGKRRSLGTPRLYTSPLKDPVRVGYGIAHDDPTLPDGSGLSQVQGVGRVFDPSEGTGRKPLGSALAGPPAIVKSGTLPAWSTIRKSEVPE